jgi:hypothetical protein
LQVAWPGSQQQIGAFAVQGALPQGTCGARGAQRPTTWLTNEVLWLHAPGGQQVVPAERQLLARHSSTSVQLEALAAGSQKPRCISAARPSMQHLSPAPQSLESSHRSWARLTPSGALLAGPGAAALQAMSSRNARSSGVSPGAVGLGGAKSAQ